MSLQALRLVCVCLVAGVLITTVTIGVLVYAGVHTPTPGLLAPLAGVVALSVPACVLAGIAVKSSLLQQARLAWLREAHDGSADAIAAFEEAYGRGTLLQVALLEGFGLLGAVCALVTGQLLFLGAPVVAMVGIGLLFPTEAKFQSIVAHLSRPVEPREQRFMDARDADMR